MLVLTRKKEEKLAIGDNITVTILKVKGNSVQIGIEAPRDVRVLRSELAFEQPQCNDESESLHDEDKSPRHGANREGVNRLRQLAGKVSRDTVTATPAVQLV